MIKTGETLGIRNIAGVTDRKTRQQMRKVTGRRRHKFLLMKGTTKCKGPEDANHMYVLQCSSSRPPTQSS